MPPLEQGKTPPALHFAQVNEKDGFFLTGRNADSIERATELLDDLLPRLIQVENLHEHGEPQKERHRALGEAQEDERDGPQVAQAHVVDVEARSPEHGGQDEHDRGLDDPSLQELAEPGDEEARERGDDVAAGSRSCHVGLLVLDRWGRAVVRGRDAR